MSTGSRQAREYQVTIDAARKAAGRLASRCSLDGDQLGARRYQRVREQLAASRAVAQKTTTSQRSHG